MTKEVPDVNDRLAIRQIQGYLVLLSSLPENGKLREAFELALDVRGRPVLERLRRPTDPDSRESYSEWLAEHWAAENLTPDEQPLVDWQKDPANITTAIGEWKALTANLNQ
ncbi:DurN family substrate-assisted peptide maturase [Parafrankia sp. EUN1f]|uniref:DurN family substrate-assisted peptide maturase n=1 Tax=Parafrankia sp. EUN1f TaxID=102897 RepID=UPI0001C46CA8|nr:DurN family substrate-assisted peptide maturase [Parafrankia sp. EUN1f]EFC80454.1 hypothetical protein FrEUN1fDRAFT_6430 [Parafrankia sp. EUN1f]